MLQGSIADEALLTLASVMFVAALGVGAWLTRRIPISEALFAYLLIVVVFAPGMANQYFEIPLAAIAAYPNAILIIWIAVATLYLLGDESGLHLSTVTELLPAALRKDQTGIDSYQVPTLLLAAGGIVAWWKVQSANRRSRESSPRDSLGKAAH